MLVQGSVPIFPTEDPDKVRSCILNIFPDAECVLDKSSIVFTTGSMDSFVNKVRNQEIRDTALMILERGIIDDTTGFNLNKQVAIMGLVNFTDGGTLGVIGIEVKEGAVELIEDIRPDLD
ncbi:MAG: RNA-binding domain-containing protein [Candidatus Thermoplasmatota archaeon]|nr:RNA-binding domain-containing protein [Candidatus Thermoplasmatota archaeon]